MNRLSFIKSDLKQMIREPMMLLLFLAPIFISIAFRNMYIFISPIVEKYIAFEIAAYDSYILSLVLLFTPMMLGIVMGFMMLDDKDANIIELMSITPLGKSGYLKNRLIFIVIPTIIYSFANYLIMGIYIINIWTLFYIALISSLLSIVIGLVFSSLATDKIKGLTYAKGLNLIVIFAFGDLFKGNMMKYISYLFPSYWISRIIANREILLSSGLAMISTIIWLLIFVNIYEKNQRNNLK